MSGGSSDSGGTGMTQDGATCIAGAFGAGIASHVIKPELCDEGLRWDRQAC